MNFQAGDRVRLTQDLGLPAGSMGTVTAVNGNLVWVDFDAIPGTASSAVPASYLGLA